MRDERLAHDVRGALQVVRLTLEQLRRRHPGAEPDIDEVEAAVDGVAELVALKGPKQVRLGAVVADVLRRSAAEIDEVRATIEVGDLPTVRAEPSRVARVVANILRNTLLHAGPGPVLTIRAEGDAVVFSDNGPGFEGQAPGHLGVQNIVELVAEDGGTAEHSGPGTTWVVRWPLSP